MQTDPNPDTLFALYHSGAFLCLGIVAAYLALRWASNHIAWLEVPGRAHYIAAVLGGVALVIGPISQGTTPNASMLMTAGSAVVALFLRGALHADSAPEKASQSGFIAPRLLVMIAAAGFALMACANARLTTLRTTLATVDSASIAFSAYDDAHQKHIATTAKDAATANAELAAWQAEQAKVEKLRANAYQTLAAAFSLDTDPSVATALQAAALVYAELKAAGVPL